MSTLESIKNKIVDAGFAVEITVSTRKMTSKDSVAEMNHTNVKMLIIGDDVNIEGSSGWEEHCNDCEKGSMPKLDELANTALNNVTSQLYAVASQKHNKANVLKSAVDSLLK